MTELVFDITLWFCLFCQILGMAHGLNILFGWDLFTCVFLTATGAVFHLLLFVLLVSITIFLFINLGWSTMHLQITIFPFSRTLRRRRSWACLCQVLCFFRLYLEYSLINQKFHYPLMECWQSWVGRVHLC